MGELLLIPNVEGVSHSDDFIEELRDDLNAEVGPTRFEESTHQPGSKGGGLSDYANLVVAILGTPAILHLIAVLKAHVERNRSVDFTLQGPGGKLRIKAGDASLLDPILLGDRIDAILNKAS